MRWWSAVGAFWICCTPPRRELRRLRRRATGCTVPSRSASGARRPRPRGSARPPPSWRTAAWKRTGACVASGSHSDGAFGSRVSTPRHARPGPRHGRVFGAARRLPSFSSPDRAHASRFRLAGACASSYFRLTSPPRGTIRRGVRRRPLSARRCRRAVRARMARPGALVTARGRLARR